MELNTQTGRVTRVNGPVVNLSGLGATVAFEYVEVGDQRLPGEIISIDHDRVVAQLYEYTGGLSVGQPAWASGRPLTVELGPGLLGGIYDGLLRPLEDAYEFLPPRGLTRPPVSNHRVEPTVVTGAVVAPGDVIASIRTTDNFDHLVLVPSGVSGQVEQIAPAGNYDST
ncbi:MAG: hypothetical protein DRJ50_10040, partial [Actinobacteria bacterium]